MIDAQGYHLHMDEKPQRIVTLSMKKDGTYWLEDKQIDKEALLQQARTENQHNSQFSVVLRADQGLDYGQVIAFLDELKSEGITRFALAAESGGAK